MRKAVLLLQFLAGEGRWGPAEFQPAQVEWLRPEDVVVAINQVAGRVLGVPGCLRRDQLGRASIERPNINALALRIIRGLRLRVEEMFSVGQKRGPHLSSARTGLGDPGNR